MRRRKSILPSIRLLTCIALACNAGFGCEKPPQGASTPEQLLASYRENLAAVRQRFGGSRDMPAPRFLLFGMGLREKYLYRSGTLIRLSDRETVERWQNSVELIVPPEYLVRVMAPDGSTLSIREDERAVWLEKAGARVPLPGTEVPVELPKFEGHRYGPILRVLHHEMLIGVLSTGQHRGGPVPNLFKFGKPWYRDAAVIAHALAGTGNLDSVRPWIASLAEPYDHNRSPEIEEADNLGQALYLLSLIGAKDHPLVPALLMELAEHEAAQEGHRYITGITDGEAHPAYQTKWAKLGLQRLGLPDPYEVPAILDGYSPVFWLDYRSAYPEKNPDAFETWNFPYLGWAVDHFHGTRRSLLSDEDYPLTWEAASTDDHTMDIVDVAYRGITTPHAWHSAEAFLYLLESP